jgi:hypothetical protein
LGAQISGKNVDVNIMMGTYTGAEGGIKIRRAQTSRTGLFWLLVMSPEPRLGLFV